MIARYQYVLLLLLLLQGKLVQSKCATGNAAAVRHQNVNVNFPSFSQ